MSFRITPHTPKASTIKLDKNRQYWILEQNGRALCYGLSEQDAKWLLELLNYGTTYLVSHGPFTGQPQQWGVTTSLNIGIEQARRNKGEEINP